MLLVLDAEALLLVHDEESEVLEAHLRREHAVRADDDVDGAVREAFHGLLDLGVGLEARERGHLDREGGVALRERAEVLLHQQGRRHEDGHLLAVLHGLERRAHRDLGLAVADVAADDAIHGHGALHVGLHLVDAGELIGSLDEREGILELALPRSVGREGMARRRLALGIEPHQLVGDLADGATRTRLGALPVGAAQLAQCRCFAADVARHLIELVGRHIEAVGRLAPT